MSDMKNGFVLEAEIIKKKMKKLLLEECLTGASLMVSTGIALSYMQATEMSSIRSSIEETIAAESIGAAEPQEKVAEGGGGEGK